MSKELQDAFRIHGERDVDTFPVTVVSVQKEKGTCTVKDDDLTYTNVQLSAVRNDSDQKFHLFPAVDSTVLVSPINEDLNRLYVEAYSKIESLALIIEYSEMKMDGDGLAFAKADSRLDITQDGLKLEKGSKLVVEQDGVGIGNQGQNLKAIMLDLITAIENMTMAHPNGPTTAVINLAQFTALKPRINTLLKDV